jgi:pyrimidine operon attenuation protein / uracil phosphoribosyltransferase
MNLPDPNQLTIALANAIAPTVNAATAIIGIHTGGVWVAQAIARHLKQQHGIDLPVGALAVTFHRDDFNRGGLKQLSRSGKATQLGFDVEGRDVLLVDDVLYTGRTTRAAINEIFDFGRPARIRLACLLDRGGRELPIAPDFCGATISLAVAQSFELGKTADDKLTLKLH